jgi:hypothetical protein
MNHHRTHVPRLIRLRSNPDMTTMTIDGPSRLSSTSLPLTWSSRTASKVDGGGGGGGGGDCPRGQRRRRRGNDNDIHDNNRIVVRRHPCVVGQAEQRWRRCPSFPRLRPWISSRNDTVAAAVAEAPPPQPRLPATRDPPRCCRRRCRCCHR